MEVDKGEKTKKGDSAVNSEPFIKDSANSGSTEQGILNSEIDHGGLSLTDKENIKNEINDNGNGKYNMLTSENEDVDDNPKLSGFFLPIIDVFPSVNRQFFPPQKRFSPSK